MCKANVYSYFFEMLLECRSVFSPVKQGTGNERVKFLVKNPKSIWFLLNWLGKWLSYKDRRFWMLLKFFWFYLTVWKPQKLKDSIFEIPIIPQTLNIKSMNLDIIRKFIQYTFKKNVVVKSMFTLTVFEILLLESRSVLSPAQRCTRKEGLAKNV